MLTGIRGERLFTLVEEYAELGDHRTGPAVDAETAGWVAEHLRALGADVEISTWEFERYDADWQLRLDGEPVEALPLFYEGIGRASTRSPLLHGAPVVAPGELVGFAEAAARARRQGVEAAVVAALGSGPRLVAVNRAPQLGSGLPTLCVSEHDLHRLAAGRVDLQLSARLVPGSSANVLGSLGDGSAGRLLVATPLSGWFRCAGERGTGIAIALEAAHVLAHEGVAVSFVATSGHELGCLGLQQYLASTTSTSTCVLHVGASVAVERGSGPERPATDRLWVTTSAPAAVPAVLPECWQLREVTDPMDPDEWLGEAKDWCSLGRPMVSLAGLFPLFHTPDDLPASATTPALLDEACDRVLTMARALTRTDPSPA